ncbi:mitochondrial aspartate-glutamate transporter agc1 [Vermiconidia calcicola]|uniref:Mitochondrial aspartate-glutamate transporter agc1 n=1 Tax=Vermiconidia calcicola TaxID=1690605 RepID=A0ACC3P0G4_9PEZI|nr:mitochondrial aspartate-glutamate transporter agc1 [Vermiconidia calcicola]
MLRFKKPFHVQSSTLAAHQQANSTSSNHDFGNEIAQFESFRATQRGAKVLGSDAVNPTPIEAEGETKFTIDNFRAIRGLCGRLEVEAPSPTAPVQRKIKREQYTVLFQIADQRRESRINLQDWTVFNNLLAKPDAVPLWRFTSSPTQSPDW